MSNKNYSLLNSLLAVLLAFCLWADTTGGKSLSLAQDPAAKVEDQDIIYSEDEVDVKAEILNSRDINPIRLGVSLDCKDNAEVKLTIVLRKSGKVSDVKVVKSAKCSLDRKSIQIVKRIKFKRAEKIGVAVSQLFEISFRQFRAD